MVNCMLKSEFVYDVTVVPLTIYGPCPVYIKILSPYKYSHRLHIVDVRYTSDHKRRVLAQRHMLSKRYAMNLFVIKIKTAVFDHFGNADYYGVWG